MRKDIKILEEKLERATKAEISRLSQQITKDSELKRMLTSPMEDIPQYRYLFSPETWDMAKQHNLFDFIQLLDLEKRQNFYFSKIGSKFTGFIVYEDNSKIISGIKMASFLDDQKKANPVMAKDLIEFVLNMAPQRVLIEWHVDPKNTNAIRQYNAVLDQKSLNWKSGKDEKWIKYTVKGLKT